MPDVSVLDTYVVTTAYPATSATSAGPSRVKLFSVIHSSSTNADPATTLTYGGQSATLVGVADSAGPEDVSYALFAVGETALAARADDAVVISGGASTAKAVITLTLQNASQTWTNFNNTFAIGSSGAKTIALTRSATSFTFAVAVCDITDSASISAMSNPSQVAQFSGTNMDVAYGGEVDTARTADFAYTIGPARDSVGFVINIESATPAGPAITNVTDPIDGTITVTTDLSTTVTHIRLTSGSVVVTQAIDSSPVTGTSFTITTLDRSLLPAIESNLTVELLNDVTVVASTTSTLITPTGTFANIVASAITNDTQSIFHPNWADGTPVNNDQIQWTTDGDVVIAATGIVSGDGGFMVRHWDSVTETWGAWAEYTVSNGVIIKVRGMSLIKRKATLPSIITTWEINKR